MKFDNQLMVEEDNQKTDQLLRARFNQLKSSFYPYFWNVSYNFSYNIRKRQRRKRKSEIRNMALGREKKTYDL